jgi:hypothetical protein
MSKETPQEWNDRANLMLLCGEIWGILRSSGLEIKVIKDGNDYRNQLRLTRPSGTYLLTVEKEITADTTRTSTEAK